MMRKEIMTKLVTILSSLLIVFCMLLVISCENDYPPSIYDPTKTGLPTPVINSVDPPELALAGVTMITILGSNFSADIANNIVFFNAAKAEIIEASETRLYVRPPVIEADSVLIRVAVQGAELFGAYNQKYKIEAAQKVVAKFNPGSEPYGVTTDAEGNIYTSMVVNNAGVGIRKIDLSGNITDWAPKGGETFYSGLKMGPEGIIYGARKVKAIFKIEAGQKGAVFASSGLGNIYDLDFDQYKNVWGVGNNDKIYCVQPNKTIKSFAFKADLRAVRIFEDYVYVGGAQDGVEKVWRFPITGDAEIGTEEEYFDFTAAIGSITYGVYAINFALDGTLYIGTDEDAAIYMVHPDKSMEPLYPGQFVPKALTFSWGKDTAGNYIRLIVTREKTASDTQTLIWANTQKEGALYYGIM